MRSWILLIGDAAVLYAALTLTLLVRGGGVLTQEFWSLHFVPFTILNVVWLAVFFANDLYHRRHYRLSGSFVRHFLRAMMVNGLLAVAFFYLVPVFGISPKTNLAIYLIESVSLLILWRALASRLIAGEAARRPVLFLDLDEMSRSLAEGMLNNPSSLFRVEGVIESLGGQENADLAELIRGGGIELIVVGNERYRQEPQRLYPAVLAGVSVMDAATFWEEYHEQIPLEVADQAWFVSGFANARHQEYEITKRLMDIASSLLFGLALLPVMAVTACLVKATSRGPVLYRQVRVGKFETPFTLYKFRTMRADAEAAGPAWAAKNDPRVTRLGRVLRHTHLDELPQLWNIFKGDMSFVGPRPERPEFVEKLKAEIPHYALRHLVKPGLSGWAQINAPYASSVAGAAVKLSYDLYYIKHRSWFLDAKVLLKTLATVWRGEGR